MRTMLYYRKPSSGTLIVKKRKASQEWRIYWLKTVSRIRTKCVYLILLYSS